MSAPGLALLNAAGEIERGSEIFRLRYAGAADAWRSSPDLHRVLAGESDRASTIVDDARAEFEAIIDHDGTRHVLLTIGGADSASDGARNVLLDEPLDDCQSLVWIKDIGGRYLRVNNRYAAFLGTSEDRLRGRTDAELPTRETVDGPRLQGRHDAIEEPLELEYVVAPFEGRPALSALRFAVRNRAGEPIAVCGVASPLGETAMAHAEAKRLIEVERFGRLDADDIRMEFLQSHNGADGAPPAPPPSGAMLPPRPPAPDHRVEIDEAATAAAAERASALAEREELVRELAEIQQRLAEQADAAATARGRAEELDRTLAAERERNSEVERALAEARAEADQARADAERARTEAELARGRADELVREHAEARERLARLEQKLESEASDSDERRREVEQARAEAERARAEAERAAAEAERARTDAEQATAEAERARGEAEQARMELEQQRTPPEGETAVSAIANLARGFELEPRTPASEEDAEPAASHDLVPNEDEPHGPPSVQWLPNAQRRLSASLARMSVWRTVLNETSSIIGSEGGWDAVTAWVPDGRGGLECAAMWTAHPGLGAFEESTWEAQQQRSGSLPAQALHAPHLTWVTEIDSVDDERLGRAASHGLRSALLLPVRDGATPIALLELLAHASIKPEAQIAMSLEAAALQLGQLGHMLHVSQ